MSSKINLRQINLAGINPARLKLGDVNSHKINPDSLILCEGVKPSRINLDRLKLGDDRLNLGGKS